MLRQKGAILLEGLIAIVIFSVGMLGLVALQTSSIAAGTNAGYRTQATMLASSLIGAAESDPANLLCYSLVPAQYAACANATARQFAQDWKDRVQAALPGAPSAPPTIDVSTGVMTVTLFWTLANGDVQHNLIVTAQPAGA